MITNKNEVNSEHALINELYKQSDAGASIIQLRTKEPIRAIVTLRKSILAADGNGVREWDEVNGERSFSLENFNNHLLLGDASYDFDKAITQPLLDLKDPKSRVNLEPNKIHYYVFLNPQKFMTGNPHYEELLIQYAAILPSHNICLIFVTEDAPIDGLPPGTIQVIDMNTPSSEELAVVLKRITDKAADGFDEGSHLEPEDIHSLAVLGLGLTLYEFETYAAISIIEAHTRGYPAITMDVMQDGISQGKTSVVKRSDILELTHTADMRDVGGMQRLKDWIGERSNCYSQEAQDFGIKPPKGMVLVGVPGTGKSLSAKAVASKLGVPSVKLDVGRVFSKYIGDSESRIRSALKMVEDMAPCVLFVDELDKGLGGIGGGGDSGTSSRVLGTLLTWLQEHTAPVFCIVTANSVAGLPPELLRRGRFDKIFSVGMPNPIERTEVLNIHLRKSGHDIKFSNADIQRFTAASNEYVPAEIESAVQDALILAFNRKEDLSMDHLVEAFENMVPMSKSNRAQIDAIIQWAETNATPVSYDTTERAVQLMAGAENGRRLRTSRGKAN